MVKNPTGRPSKFPTVDKEQIKKLVMRGFTDKEIADFFNINQDTFYEWKKKYPIFSEALKDWKDDADKKVEAALYQRATGYEHDSEEIFCFQGDIIRAEVKKKYAPSEVACIFWLKNRHPVKWRDKPIEILDEDLKETQLDFKNASDPQIEQSRLARFYN